MHRISSFCTFVAHQQVRMSSSYGSYEEAIRKLNKLQSNKAAIEQIRRDRHNGKACTNIDDMVKYLSRTGVSLSMLDSLSVIHIAGTKGKGSTSAMCESILRHHGCRTGFYSSPHLVEVRERIRLEGRIVDKEHFSKHFHRVYNMLYNTQAYEDDMPKYFAFMTVLAFNVFLTEKVDVAIVEVGIGGIVDYTNVLRKAPVVGITALGIDHTAILGNTLPQIAAAKAGIMKPGCVAYTVNQPQEAMDVLRKVAKDVKCSLEIVPDYSIYKFPNNLGNESPYNLEAYQMNASLAIQLAHAWLHQNKVLKINQVNGNSKINGEINMQNGHNKYDSYIYECDKFNGNVCNVIQTIPEETVAGLRACKWPGRFQVIKTDYAHVYLDGAHTKESIEICAKWFQQNTRFQDKILIFCTTGNRDSELLLWPLRGIHFKTVYFVAPTAYQQLNLKNDNYSIIEHSESLSVCNLNVKIWNRLCEHRSQVVVKQCVSTALLEIERLEKEKPPSVLVTGSLHLVGAAISILDPCFP